jgi:glycosyltransferase involved in cell wall biosynthesis
MKIAITTDGIFPHSVGGMQRHSKFLIEGLARHFGADAELHVIHPHDDAVFRDYPNVIEHHLTHYKQHKIYLIDCFRYSQGVSDILDQIGPDAIYAQGLTMWAGLNLWGSKTIVNPHGLEPHQSIGLKDRLVAIPFKLVFNHIFRRSAKVVSLGGKLTTILQGIVPESKIVILPNGIDLELFPMREETPSKFNFLFVGRFASNKGISNLLDVSRQLIDEGHRFELNLIGKGPLYDNLVSEYGVLEWIKFHGFASDDEIAAAYRQCSVFVLPTLFEGMPTVVLEAMASGAPIIVSDVGACREMVGEENGWVIEPGNNASLYNAMKESLGSTTLSSKSRHSVQKVRSFTWLEVTELTARILR